MKISSIDTRLYHVPLPNVLTDSMHGQMRHFAVVTVEVHTDDGAEGLGYTYTVGKTGGSAVLAMIRDDLAPTLAGADPRRIEQLWKRMWWHLHYVGRGGVASFAISAVDVALWDLKAKLADEPLWRFLGGHSNRAKVYAGGIDLELSLDQLARQTEENLNRGYRAIKMKVGRDRLAEDVERVAAMRKLLGPEIPLMVDANMRWTVDEAIRASRAFAEYDVYWLEEPTIPDDVDGHRRIESEGPLPVATGENLHTIYEFQKMIAAGGVSFPEPDLSNVGGVTGWLEVAHLAEAHNLPVTTHGVHDLHVHLLAAVPNASYLEAHGFGLEAYIREPLAIEDGWALAPDRPGHGVQFDRDKLEEHRAGG
jgi:L-alanine-DL-glutamate epimerase-like enolase superfamily enzyme